MEITDRRRIDDLLNILHDRAYELESLAYDSQNRKLTLLTSVIADQPVEGRYEVFKAFLHILECGSYELSDEAKIGEGDFNRIEFEGGSVVITGSLPVTLTANVDRLHLKLETTAEILRTVSSFRRSYLKS